MGVSRFVSCDRKYTRNFVLYFAIERRAEARGVGLHSSDQSSEGSDDSQPEENALVEGGNYRSDNYHSL